MCRLDKWDDVQGQWFGAVIQKTDTPFFLCSDAEIRRVLDYPYIFSDPVLCCMMAFDHQGVVTKKSGKDSLCETWISLVTKMNQRLYRITHSSSIGLLSMLLWYYGVVLPSQLLKSGTHPAFHTMRGRTPCVLSVLPNCPVKWNSLQCSSSIELLVFSWSYCAHALPGEILILRVLVSCLNARISVLCSVKGMPHPSFSCGYWGYCLWLNSPLLLEDVIKSHKWGGNHLWAAQRKNLLLQSCFMSPQCH